jgi:tetratricopeptide (TPR) repeat protein
MEKLHFLIRSLSLQQRKILKVLQENLSSNKKTDTQSIRLVNLLLEQAETPSIEACSMALYGKMNYFAIQKIKSRLTRDIKNLLLFDSGMEKRKGSDDPLIDQGIAIRREMAQFYILLGKSGNSAVLQQVMNEILRMAKTYEVYPALVEMLNHKKWMSGFRQGEPAFAQIEEQVTYYQRCYTSVTKAADFYHLGIIRSEFTDKKEKREFQHFLRESIAELNESYVSTHSAQVLFYLKHLEIMYYTGAGNPEVTHDVAIELLEIIKTSKAVHNKSRVGSVYGVLAACHMRMARYAKAIACAKASQRCFIKNSANYFNAMEYEFLANLYLGKTKRSKTICQKMLRSEKKETGDFRSSKYLYYLANICFLQKDFKQCLCILSQKLDLSKDKQGWDIQLRILLIMAMLELGHSDEAENQVFKLEKQAKQLGDSITLRQKMIVGTLCQLCKAGFSYSQAKSKMLHNLSHLVDFKEYAWDPVGAEQVRFELWLAEKYPAVEKRKKVALLEVEKCPI